MGVQSEDIRALQRVVASSDRGACVNLNVEAQRAGYPETGANVLLDARVCETFVREVAKKHGAEWTYGGFREDRSFLWRGSYLAETQSFIHAGVDLNAPAGVAVISPGRARVLRVDDDSPQPFGWGPRIALQFLSDPDLVLLLAHLERVEAQPGELVAPVQMLARIGRPPRNGGWYPHVHLQLVQKTFFDEVMQSEPEWLDGYYPAEKGTFFESVYLDPIPFLHGLEGGSFVER